MKHGTEGAVEGEPDVAVMADLSRPAFSNGMLLNSLLTA